MERRQYYYPRLAGLAISLGFVFVLAGGLFLLRWREAWFESAVYVVPAFLMLLLGYLLVVRVENNPYGWV